MGLTRKKRLLIVAFHFPPLNLSSGVHRTLSLVRYLPDDGWDVSVLTVKPNVYRRVHDDNLSLIPESCRVIRTPAFDTSRHLSVRGRYPRMLAIPDNYQSWIATAVPAGILHCRRHRPDVILSTYPIASAHYIGWLLGKITRVPWVADFRDPMAQDDYPPDIRLRRALHNLEHRVVANAKRIFVTTPGTRRIYSRRYSGLPPDRLRIVPNGFDPAILDGPGGNRSKDSEKRILVHSGNIYRNERDPTHFFEALALLKNDEPELMSRVRIMLRGTRHTEYFQEIVKRLDIGSIVVFGEPVTYQAAVSEMQSADGLLILQASNCNEQIPAKVYEYIYVRKPIIALTDPVGDTARLLASCGVTSVARLDDPGSISRLLKKFLNGDPSGFNVDKNFDVEQFSRQRIAMTVSSELSELAS